MKLNIFQITPANYDAMANRLSERGLVETWSGNLSGWEGKFLFSQNPSTTEIPWTRSFKTMIGSGNFRNVSYYGALLLEKADSKFAISFGKSHFYIRPFCDYDFGIELAKRIADESDVSQTASRKFAGKHKKEISSFANDTHLMIAPGSSVDYLQGRILKSKQAFFGKSARFGT